MLQMMIVVLDITYEEEFLNEYIFVAKKIICCFLFVYSFWTYKEQLIAFFFHVFLAKETSNGFSSTMLQMMIVILDIQGRIFE